MSPSCPVCPPHATCPTPIKDRVRGSEAIRTCPTLGHPRTSDSRGGGVRRVSEADCPRWGRFKLGHLGHLGHGGRGRGGSARTVSDTPRTIGQISELGHASDTPPRTIFRTSRTLLEEIHAPLSALLVTIYGLLSRLARYSVETSPKGGEISMGSLSPDPDSGGRSEQQGEGSRALSTPATFAQIRGHVHKELI